MIRKLWRWVVGVDAPPVLPATPTVRDKPSANVTAGARLLAQFRGRNFGFVLLDSGSVRIVPRHRLRPFEREKLKAHAADLAAALVDEKDYLDVTP
jgi:hypothetical protein